MDTKKSPTVVISKKDIVDENTLKNLLKSSCALDENTDATIGGFSSRNLITSTPVASKCSTKSRISLKSVGARSSGQSSKRSRNRNNYDDEDDNEGMQTFNEGAMEASLNLSHSLTLEDCEDIKMDTNLASLIEQEMFNPSDSFPNEFDSTCNGKSRKKSRKNPTPKRKKNNNGKAAHDDEDFESSESNTIRNIKTPICLPKKRKIDDLDKSFDEQDSTTRRTSRSAAVRARQRVKRLELDNDPANASFGGQDDDEYVEETSKVDDDDDDEFDGSLDDDDDDDDDDDNDSIVIKKEVSKIPVVKEAGKKKKWSDVYDKDIVLKLRQQQQHLNLLPDWMPRRDFYKEIASGEGKKFLPVSQKVKFRVQCRASIPPPERSIELDLFEHHVSEDAFTIKIGGPLWSMDWCPTPMGKPCNQYLALYTHQSPAQTFTTGIPSSFENKCLIQIWDFGRLARRMSATAPDLLPLLVVDGGPIWQMKWAPGASTWISGVDDDDTFNSRIGLLACACHCGNVKIYSIPRFSRKRDTTASIPQSQKVPLQQRTYFEVTPTLTLKTTGSTCIPCICVDWNVSEKCLIIAAGFVDGAVALWNLSTQVTMLSGIKTEDGDPSKSFMYPYRTFKAHLSVVSGLHFCPTTDDLLLTCSHDKYMKVWNIHEANRCVLSHRTYKITASTWPANERSRFYAGFDEAYILQRNSVACYNFYESKVVHISHCLHNGTINCISHKEWSSIITGCDNTGCVQSCLSIPEKIKGIFSHRKLITMVQVEDDDESTEDATCKCKSFCEPQREDVGSFPISCCCNKSFIIKDFNKHWQFKSSIKSQNELPFDDMVKNPHSALHRVSWNPNKESCDWIAFGGVNGLLRIRFVPDSQTQKK